MADPGSANTNMSSTSTENLQARLFAPAKEPGIWHVWLPREELWVQLNEEAEAGNALQPVLVRTIHAVILMVKAPVTKQTQGCWCQQKVRLDHRSISPFRDYFWGCEERHVL